jgi:hypothetical protein
MTQPKTKWIGDIKHRLVVFMDVGKKAGRYSLVRMIRDHEVVHLAGGEEFFTAYIPEHVYEVRTDATRDADQVGPSLGSTDPQPDQPENGEPPTPRHDSVPDLPGGQVPPEDDFADGF